MNLPKLPHSTASTELIRPSEAGVPARPPAAPAPDALGLLKALRKRWALALALGLLLAGTAGPAVWYLVPRAKYTARATLYVASKPQRIVFEPQDNRAEYRTYQQTQVALLTDRKILAHALSQPEVAALATVREQVDPEEWLETQLQVRFIRTSEVLEVTLRGDRPKDLAEIVNAVVRSYMTLIVAEERRQQLERLDSLQKLWDRYQGDLKRKRSTLKELAGAVGSHDQATLALTQQFRIEHLRTAQRELMQAQAERRKLEAELAALEAAPAAGPATEAEVAELVESHREVAALKARLQELASLHQSTQRLAQKPSDPALARVRGQWEAARDELDRLRATVRMAALEQHDRRREGTARADLARLRGQVGVWAAYQEELARDIQALEAEVKSTVDGGLDLEEQHQELGLATGMAQRVGGEIEAVKVELDAPERVRVLSQAAPPRSKDELRQLKAGGVAGLGAFALTLIGIAFWEFRARRVDTAEEVVGGLGLRLVGALPALPARRRAGLRALPDRRWQSLLIESVDAARTTLLYASRVEALRTVMITSAVKGEGKTSLACHLATSLARAGRRTLLVDCDLRSPACHRLFDLEVQPGLCELLRGEAVLGDVVREVMSSGLDLIPAGRCDALALQRLAQDHLPVVFQELRARYDFVLVDTAPLLPVADTLLIGQHVDGAILSVLRDVSRLPMVGAARERLAAHGIRTLGAVVAGVPSDSAAYSYYTAASAAT